MQDLAQALVHFAPLDGVAHANILEPEVLRLDDPCPISTRKLCRYMREEIRKIQQNMSLTAVPPREARRTIQGTMPF